MRLFFDARYIRTDFHDGISRYSAELGAAVHRIADVTFLICDEGQRALLPDGATTVMFSAPTSAREAFAARRLNRLDPDVVFSPLQSIGSFGRHFPLILTVHDLIYYRHRTPPAQFNWLVRLGWRLFYLSYLPQRIALNSASMVATVSRTAEADIRGARLTKRPIVVVPNAPRNLTELIGSPSEIPVGTPRNLVYMGSFMGYKDVETLVDATALLPAGYRLHLLSRITEARRVELTARAKHADQLVFHNGVTDEQYAALLADEAILVSASRDEGYGLPVAEALAMGVPAVITDMPIFREVAGEGAEYFSPGDATGVADAVLRLADPVERARVVAAGRDHIARYDWNRSARILVDAALSLVTAP